MQHDPNFLKLAEIAKKHITEQDIHWVKENLDKDSFILIDVREESEWAKGHIPGAIHLSKGIIERDIAKKVDSMDTPLVLYCGGGSRSAIAAINLKQMGYTNVISMNGGWRGWNGANYPTEQNNQ